MISEHRLKAVAQEGDIGGLYQLIQEDPRVLDHEDSILFVETPLHVAASAGHLQFATEIMRLKPSFARKLNPQGFTPIHLALKEGHNNVVLNLVNINKDLVGVKGRESFTPLHYASQTGQMDLLTMFLKACPHSIEDVTVRYETALHIALKCQKWKAFKFLVKWLETNVHLEKTILNWKDEDGNTVLHVAASHNDIKAMSLLMKPSMDFDAKNLEHKTALDLVPKDVKRKLLVEEGGYTFICVRKTYWMISSFITEPLIHLFGLKRDMSVEQINSYLVVSTLVATATYQAALSPPGGLYQTDAAPNHVMAINSSINTNPTVGNEGNSIMPTKDFITFSLLNMSSFMASTLATFFLLPRTPALIPLFLTIILLQWSYYYSMAVISPTPLTTGVVGWIFVVLEEIFLAMTCLTTIFKLSKSIKRNIYKLFAPQTRT
ncbi:Ankyrin repeat-containing protein [Spatholobus suberectus]|nr:Ankyrin repeat-containing protein [Spatholobus suberectus]